jgi:hypothetical protein
MSHRLLRRGSLFAAIHTSVPVAQDDTIPALETLQTHQIRFVCH